MSHEDLAPLFGPGPAVPSQDVRWRQGTIVTFNQITLQNTVLVGGTVMTDLPLHGVGEATLLAPGAVVGILCVGDQGAHTMYIAGRIVTPNTAEAINAVTLLSAQMAVDFDTTDVSTTSSTYVDLGGPSVTGVVRGSGRVLVLTDGLITGLGEVEGGAMRDTAVMAVALSGANTLAASDEWGRSQAFSLTPTTNTLNVISRACSAHLFEGLTPGETTFKVMYHARPTGTTTADFSDRIVVVFFL